MLDHAMRRVLEAPLGKLADVAVKRGISANRVTIVGLIFGIACGVFIASGTFALAFLALIASRVADGMDGAIARRTALTDFGGFLDIVCDFVFYASIPVGFALLDGGRCALAASVLLGSFYLNGASFLGFAVLAAKRGMEADVSAPKALYYTSGLAEGTETIIVFSLMLLWPEGFPVLAYGFAALCIFTFVSRILLAARVFAVDGARDRHS